MPRPRQYDPDEILDAVESLAVRSGLASVTIRAISAAVGISNGALYHTFGSRGGLIGGACLRAARRFFALQNSLVDEVLSSPSGRDGIEAVVAAADAPTIFAEQQPSSSALLLVVRNLEALGDDIPPEIEAELKGLRKQLVGLLIRLALGVWDRKDSAAVDVITTCVVDLPTAILLRRDRLSNSVARDHLRAAVRAVLVVGPPALLPRV